MYILSEVREIAKSEGLSIKTVIREIKNGRASILRNVKRNIRPKVVGRKFRCKYNLNLGLSPKSSDITKEIQKLELAIKNGADTVMDLSVGRNCDETRRELLARCSIPFGTVPIYTMINDEDDIRKLSKNLILETIEKQCEEGVDFMTIHAGLLKKSIKYIRKRTVGVVSRGGSLILRYMSETGKENPFYEYFDEIVKILKKYRVAISIGDGLRPGCIADATDKAQLSELKVIGELNAYCRKNKVFTMIEGPGHVPINQIEKNVKIAIKYCNDAPLYFLGPLVSDIAIGWDDVCGAIGSAIAGYLGVSLLCAVGPTEHIGLPNKDDIRRECVIFHIVKHAVNIAKGFKDEFDRDKKLSIARKNFDWETQFLLSIDPEYAKKKFCELNKDMDRSCSMCGETFCAMRNTEKGLLSIR